MCCSWDCTEASTYSTGRYLLTQDLQMEHGGMDLIHRRAHPDCSLRGFHVLLLQSQPELKIRCVPSLIYPVYLYIPIFTYSPIYNRNNSTSYEDVES